MGATGSQGAWTGVNLAAGGLIDFPGIPAQNASNQSCANAGNSQILLLQRGQKSLHVKPHARAERDRFSTTSPTKSLLTFVPWAKQSQALSVQGCLQSPDADFAGCSLLPSLRGTINPLSQATYYPGTIPGSSLVPVLPYYQLHGQQQLSGRKKEKLLDPALL